MVGLKYGSRQAEGAHEFVELHLRSSRDEFEWGAAVANAVKELLDASKHPFMPTPKRTSFWAALEWARWGPCWRTIIDGNHNRFPEAKRDFSFYSECSNVEVAAALGRARQWTFERGARFLRRGEPIKVTRGTAAGWTDLILRHGDDDLQPRISHGLMVRSA